jgi:alkaline phosphatase
LTNHAEVKAMPTRRQFVKTLPVLGTGLLVAKSTSPAALASAPVRAFAADAPKPRNVILMISDGCGFNGWLAADYYQGRAGKQPYQVTRPDGTRPYVGASAHYALRLFGPYGQVLANDQWDAARGVEAQGCPSMIRNRACLSRHTQ